MDDVKFGAIPMALGTSEHPDSDLRLILRLTRADIRKDVVVVPGDDPSLDVLEVDHPEVSCRRSGMRRAELPQDLGGLFSKLSIRSGRGARNGRRQSAGRSPTCWRLRKAGR
ncbi:hypothetical protein [Streptomyces lutosisoli]|uniref:Uncharacterized protein n=1 Tax=Streptomyces lutosisoli TaxID=2665721 RepID=A0ABW2VYN0_9ACTN